MGLDVRKDFQDYAFLSRRWLANMRDIYSVGEPNLTRPLGKVYSNPILHWRLKLGPNFPGGGSG